MVYEYTFLGVSLLLSYVASNMAGRKYMPTTSNLGTIHARVGRVAARQ